MKIIERSMRSCRRTATVGVRGEIADSREIERPSRPRQSERTTLIKRKKLTLTHTPLSQTRLQAPPRANDMLSFRARAGPRLVFSWRLQPLPATAIWLQQPCALPLGILHPDAHTDGAPIVGLQNNQHTKPHQAMKVRRSVRRGPSYSAQGHHIAPRAII